ncbi:flagellar assembly protein FliH [Shewanella sp. NIFS-20-20]|uniref:flagellar assembly protein FliH n=1 Tax=Shewanella sp. NIFS-20-20 TaxID=2853806 RepID=UPI001C4915AD|nr:flagellar assembly protein FliH [Shewanella sp. NIFS-20-20]MBV7314794.1 flagellar assembly protein FliH [Shewanella sp. NIFS-20-20]
MAEKISRNLVRPDELEQFEDWRVPDVSHEIVRSAENMFGRAYAQRQPQSESNTNVMPPTMAELEQIRLEAEQEGFAEGREQGLQQGLEAGRLEGLEQGHQQGFSQGEQQGYEQGMAAAAELIARFNGLMQQFTAPLALLDDEIEYQLLSLTQALSQAVIGHELSTHPEHILHTLKQGIDALPLANQQITILLNPTDVALVARLYGEEQLQKNDWDVQADPCLKPGDCQIKSGRSLVDLRLQQRLASVLAHTTSQMQELDRQIDSKQQQLEKAVTRTEPAVEPSEAAATIAADDAKAQSSPEIDAPNTDADNEAVDENSPT